MERLTLDTERCFEALASKDPRFDGRFFVAVATTGIFCRPICPAPRPRRRNVTFFPTAAAAAEAGFRPCLRCRPEAAPGSPAWAGTETVVRRGLRRIADGALDGRSSEDLAKSLGVGAHHLRRLFLRHLGATPHRVAATRRLLFAKKLIDETDLPLADVALAAGYATPRRMRAVFRDTYGRSPTDLRSASRKRRPTRLAGGLTLALPVRPPFDWAALLDFLGRRAIAGVETVEGESYRRTFRLGETTGTIFVGRAPDAAGLELHVTPAAPTHLLRLVEGARRLFDLDADPRAIADHLAGDRLLRPRVRRRPGLRVPGAWDPWEIAVRAVLGQQVSVAAATTLAGRISRRFGEPLGDASRDGLDRLFPQPEALIDADLRAVGLTRARAATVEALARLFASRGFDTEALIALPGIGDWTAQYVAMRAGRDPDAFPAGDLGIRKALAAADGTLPGRRAVLERAEAWRPWRAYAAMHLWQPDA